jgi:hypothetical protein
MMSHATWLPFVSFAIPGAMEASARLPDLGPRTGRRNLQRGELRFVELEEYLCEVWSRQ